MKKRWSVGIALSAASIGMVAALFALSQQLRKPRPPVPAADIPLYIFNPDSSMDELRRELSQAKTTLGRERLSRLEECFTSGSQSLKQGRESLNEQRFIQAIQQLGCAVELAPAYATCYNLANAHFEASHYKPAQGLYERAIAYDPERIGAYNGLGLALINQGRWREGFAQLERALALAKCKQDKGWQGIVLSNLGVIYTHRGETEQALDYHDQALELARQLNYQRGEAAELINLSHLHGQLGDMNTCLAYQQQALKIRQRIGYRLGEADTLMDLAQTYSSVGEWDKALKCQQQAWRISREIGYHEGEISCLGNIGNIYFYQQRDEEAISYYRQALQAMGEAEHSARRATILSNMGLVYHKQGQPKQALDYLQQAEQIYRQLGDTVAADEVHHLLQQVKKQMTPQRIT